MSENVISIVKNAQKSTISVKAKSAKNRFQECKKMKIKLHSYQNSTPCFCVFSFELIILKSDRFRVIIDVGLKSSYLALAIITKMQQSLFFPTSKN